MRKLQIMPKLKEIIEAPLAIPYDELITENDNININF